MMAAHGPLGFGAVELKTEEDIMLLQISSILSNGIEGKNHQNRRT